MCIKTRIASQNLLSYTNYVHKKEAIHTQSIGTLFSMDSNTFVDGATITVIMFSSIWNQSVSNIVNLSFSEPGVMLN